MFAVIDGAPNAGKSTTIGELRQRGFLVMNEVAEQVIKEGVHKPWLGDAEQLAFQTEVALRQAAQEASFQQQPQSLVFLDRGLVAAIAYRLIYGRSLTHLHNSMQASQYSVAFLLEPVESWSDNGVRYEDPKFAREMTAVMKRVYESFNVPTIVVPVDTVANRLSFIMQATSHYRSSLTEMPERMQLPMAAAA